MKQWLLPILLILLLILAFATGLNQYISLTALQSHQQVISQWTAAHPILAPALFVMCYIIATAVSFPGATILTLISGFIFGIVGGGILVIISATIGALIPFIAARSALADALRQKAGKHMQKFEAGFQRNQVSYLLFLRLVPIFPFWLINITAGLLSVRATTFIWTTLIGIIPGSVVYVSVGNGMSAALTTGNEVNLGIIFQPEILIPLLGLGILSLAPIAIKQLPDSRTNRQ